MLSRYNDKAFNKYDELHQLIVSKNIDFDDVKIISNLNWGQKANAIVENQPTEEIEIRRGMRQSSILTPLLFNLYSKATISKTLKYELVVVVINAEVVNDMR